MLRRIALVLAAAAAAALDGPLLALGQDCQAPAPGEAEGNSRVPDLSDDDGDRLSLLHFKAKYSIAPQGGFALPFAYSILGPGGSLVARLILPLTEPCPEDLLVVRGGGVQKVPVAVHAEPVVGHSLFRIDGEAYNTMNGVNLSISSPHPAFNFPDRVCEARVDNPGSAQRAHFVIGESRLSVPLPPASPNKYLVVGDTGLRIKSKNDGWCNTKASAKHLYSAKTCPPENLTAAYDPAKVSGMFQKADDSIDPAMNGWPWDQVASAASREVQKCRERAVVVHVGDYTYRHEACPLPFPTLLTRDQQEQQRTFGDCTAVGANWGDTQEGWFADFFAPAVPLLRAAPWIVLRGNHETCKRGGMGWFRYLDPRPADSASSAYPFCLSETEPYAVDFEDDQWLVLDSSSIKNEEVGIDDFPQAAFTAEHTEAFANTAVLPMSATCIAPDSGEGDLWMVSGLMDLVTPGKRHWIAVHRPVYALAFESEGDDEPSKLYSFQCELANALALAGISVPDVPAIVSGHVHYFQLVQYQQGAAQIAFGNGGTQLKTPLNGQPIGLDSVAGDNITVLGDLVVNSPTVGQWGYGVFATRPSRPGATMTAKFLSDDSFAGHEDVTADLPLRTFSVPGTAWRASGAASR